MSKTPSPKSTYNPILKLLPLIIPVLMVAGTVGCGGVSSGSTKQVQQFTPPPVASMLFSADFNGLSGRWCPTDSAGNTAAIKTLRIWDSGMKWSDLEPANGQFNWSTIDNAVNNLVTDPSCPMGVIYTVGQTPVWASACAGQSDPSPCLPGPTTAGYGGGTQCAPGDGTEDFSCTPPSDVNPDGTGTDAQFQNFINTLVSRYPGKITYYEVWNEADSPNFWCPAPGQGAPSTCNGSLQIMVRMGWDLWNIVHCVDSQAQVLSPSFHGFSSGAGGWMNQFVNTSIDAPAGSIGNCSWAAATVTGKKTFDITNFHGRGSPTSDPTAFLGVYAAAVGEIQRDNLPTQFFDDENGYEGLADAPNTDIQAGYVAISYVLRASVGSSSDQPYPILLSSWYAWNAPQGELQGQPGGLAYDVVAQWLSGSAVGTCVVSGTIYSCPGTTSSGKAFEIMWDMSQSCNAGCTTPDEPVTGPYSTWTDLTGNPHSISGGTAPVGYKPILLE